MGHITEREHQRMVRNAEARMHLSRFVEMDLAKKMPDLTALELAGVFTEEATNLIRIEVREDNNTQDAKENEEKGEGPDEG